jgi:hypothetical protein
MSNGENTSYQFELEKSSYEPPKTNYLNTIFSEHEKMQDTLNEKDLSVKVFERKVRMYIGMLKSKYREPIIQRIDKNYKTNLESFKEKFGEPDAKDKEQCYFLALIDAVGEVSDVTCRYYDADGVELKVFAYGMFGYDIEGKPYCLMDPDRAWEYIQTIDTTLSEERKKKKSAGPKKVNVEVPFDMK